ncbi:C40 family peptidase [Paraburkholderia hayleyella]|uniref:C40 family peptidase n=1 Tax=Paraburkholderia hayleyella TaxID=2152889 RepID=UPI0012919165|nr:C40 family peptidase [Paraburkholderia hayleyella]
MRRFGFSLLIVLLLTACAGPPQKVMRSAPSLAQAPSGSFRPPQGFPNFVDHSIGREEISIQAMSLVGVPYRWGGNTPDSGFDCSGLVRYVVLRAASVSLPRTTLDMSGHGQTIEPDEIAPGDLIFFNTTGRAHSHVGIYAGKLRFVNAPSTGGTVRLDYLTNPYWAKRFDGIRRVAPPNTAPTPFNAPLYQASASMSTPPQALPDTPAVAAVKPTQVALENVRLTQAANRPITQPVTTPVATSSSATRTADPFEPPPPSLSAAQRQALAAGAITPTPVQAETAITAARVPGAASDAFEPPPTASMALRQAQRAQHTEATGANVQVIRTSTPAVPSDDPIARFANGNF